METWEWVVTGVTILLALMLLAGLVRIRTRRSHLRGRFGPEYTRAVSDTGIGAAERHLSAVELEHEKLELRRLPTVTRERYLEEWRQAETRFVSDPRDATRAAESLVLRVLEERGYPRDEDAERLATLVAVDHPDVATRYRHGRALLENVDGAESTENLRKAMLDFRAMLDDVLQDRRTAA
jgi:DNA/RNA-binding domain of Phe-tRNA-synthetase-like protein